MSDSSDDEDVYYTLGAEQSVFREFAAPDPIDDTWAARNWEDSLTKLICMVLKSEGIPTIYNHYSDGDSGNRNQAFAEMLTRPVGKRMAPVRDRIACREDGFIFEGDTFFELVQVVMDAMKEYIKKFDPVNKPQRCGVVCTIGGKHFYDWASEDGALKKKKGDKEYMLSVNIFKMPVPVSKKLKKAIAKSVSEEKKAE